jgi:hypothetical protein
MKNFTTAVILTSLLFGAPAMAGSGHDHGHSHAQTPVSQAMAEKSADNVIASLVEREKIDKTWAVIKAQSIKKNNNTGHPEWVVIYLNDNVTDTEKKKLYVFLTIAGEYIAANYTGK